MKANKLDGYFDNALFFSIGFIVCFILMLGYFSSDVEKPFGFNFFNQSVEAPGDWIKPSQIQVTGDSIIIKVVNVSLSSYAPTGSMKPTLDAGANGIRIVPKTAEQIKVGDIVTYGNENIVHRVAKKGKDNFGYWFVMKGDNNGVNDGVKVRFSEIKYVTIGVLY